MGFFKLDKVVSAAKTVKILPGEEHKFKTWTFHETKFRIKNNNIIGEIEVWARGKKQGGGSVPKNADESECYNTYGYSVTVKNKGKSTFTITCSRCS